MRCLCFLGTACALRCCWDSSAHGVGVIAHQSSLRLSSGSRGAVGGEDLAVHVCRALSKGYAENRDQPSHQGDTSNHAIMHAQMQGLPQREAAIQPHNPTPTPQQLQAAERQEMNMQ